MLGETTGWSVVGGKALSLLKEKRHLFALPISDPMASRTVLAGRLLYLAYVEATDLAAEGPFDPRILRALVDGLTTAGILTRDDEGRVALAAEERLALDEALDQAAGRVAEVPPIRPAASFVVGGMAPKQPVVLDVVLPVAADAGAAMPGPRGAADDGVRRAADDGVRRAEDDRLRRDAGPAMPGPRWAADDGVRRAEDDRLRRVADDGSRRAPGLVMPSHPVVADGVASSRAVETENRPERYRGAHRTPSAGLGSRLARLRRRPTPPAAASPARMSDPIAEARPAAVPRQLLAARAMGRGRAPADR